MKKQTKLENNGWSFIRKAILLIGTFGLFAWANTSMAQCPVPAITPSGTLDLCTGGSVTLTADAGASYLWSNGATTQAIIVTTSGSFSVTVNDGVGCIATSAITTVVKNTATPGGFGNITGSTKACPGQSHVYSHNPVPRASYYIWTLPAGATIGGLSSFQTTGTSVTVDFAVGFVPSSIQITAYNGCGTSGPINKNVGLDVPVTPASISGPASTCAGVTYTFSTPVVAGVTSYNWTFPAGGSISGQGTNQVNITFPVGYVTGYVSVANQNSCGTSGSRSLNTRSVAPKPQNITGVIVGLCGTTETYSIPPVVGATSYLWTAPSGGSSVISGQGTTTVQILFNSNLNNGYVRVVAVNACGNSGESKLRVDGEVLITSDPADVNACAGDSISFIVNTQGLGVSYQWLKNGSVVSNGGTISGATTNKLTINPVVTGDAGLYACVVSNNCSDPDTSGLATLTVSDVTAAPGPISGPPTACSGTSGIPYSISPVIGATSYLWEAIDGATIATGQGTTNVTVDFGPSTTSGFTLRAYGINSCGVSDTVSAWIRRTISTPNFSVAPITACPNATGVAYEVNPVSGASSYNWTAPANASIASGQGTEAVDVDFDPSFTSGQICVTASNGCYTTPQRCQNIVSSPPIPSTMGGPGSNVCNSSAVYSINNIPSATIYTWSAPFGSTISAGQNTNSVTIDFGPTFTTGTITVVAKNACGDSPVRSKTVTGPPSKPTGFTGNAAPCANSSGNVYSVAPVTGATNYQWTIPAGASITSGAGTTSITVTFGSTGGNLNVKSENACGLSSAVGFSVSFSCRMQNATSELAAVNVYPNPAADKLYINHESSVTGEVSIIVTDLAGRIVMNELVNVSDGNQTSELNISTLKTGIYLIETRSSVGSSVTRFAKQ